jgi:hypothetical protein
MTAGKDRKDLRDEKRTPLAQIRNCCIGSTRACHAMDTRPTPQTGHAYGRTDETCNRSTLIIV